MSGNRFHHSQSLLQTSSVAFHPNGQTHLPAGTWLKVRTEQRIICESTPKALFGNVSKLEPHFLTIPEKLKMYTRLSTKMTITVSRCLKAHSKSMGKGLDLVKYVIEYHTVTKNSKAEDLLEKLSMSGEVAVPYFHLF